MIELQEYVKFLIINKKRKVSSRLGTYPTIPRPQCDTCLQKNQIAIAIIKYTMNRKKRDGDRNDGLRSWSFVILMVNCFPVCRPESKPADEPLAAAKYVQGFSNVDCVTEWARFLWRNV